MECAQLLNAMEQCAPLHKLPTAARQLASKAFQKLECTAGSVILEAGDPANEFYIVGSGTFCCTSPEVNHGRSLLGRFRKHEMIAERNVYILRPGRSPFGVTCEEDGALYVLDKKVFSAIRVALEISPGTNTDCLQALRSLPACQAAGDGEVRALAAHVRTIACKPGSNIMHRSKPSDGVLVVLSGSLTVPLPKRATGEVLSLDFSAGDVVGERDLADLVSELQIWQQSGSVQVFKAKRTALLLQVPEGEESKALMPARMAWLAKHGFALKVMQSMDVFQVLTQEQREQLVLCGRVRDCSAGELISKESKGAPAASRMRRNSLDAEAAYLSIVLSGTVRICKDSEELGKLSIGEHFGGKNIVDPSAPRETRVTAEGPVQLLQLNAAALSGLGGLIDLVRHSLSRELASRRWILENRGKVQLDQLEQNRLIGIGSFGRVRMVVHAPTGRPYALKIISKRRLVASNQVENVNAEVALTTACSHAFTLKLAAAFQDATSLYMVLEFIQGGELYRLMNSETYGGKFDVHHARLYSASIVAVFVYLNTLSIAHRDLKPENVMLTATGQVKLIDFGLAKVLTEGKTFTFCGTPDYMAPEVLVHRGYGLAVDWWALGCFIFEMLTGAPPFDYDEPEQEEEAAEGVAVTPQCDDTYGLVLKYVAGSFSIPFPEGFDGNAKDLVMRLCDASPTRRYGPQQTKQHPFFRGLDFIALENGSIEMPYKPPLQFPSDTSSFDEIDDAEEDATIYPEESVATKAALPHSSTFRGFVRVPTYAEQEGELVESLLALH